MSHDTRENILLIIGGQTIGAFPSLQVLSLRWHTSQLRTYCLTSLWIDGYQKYRNILSLVFAIPI